MRTATTPALAGFGPSSLGRLDIHPTLAVIRSARGDVVVPDTRWEILSAPTPVRLVWRPDGARVEVRS